ncbi:HMG box domain-containing protein [Citrus sinensis]|uniref:HMG box domain-containing protein n=1 Tax=Citrus sinensis TaxID=2711 RepID=A0ACB8L1Y3_CITSI|nr:HMG box domain-containing protein [Citrus sinensis]
MANQPRTRKRVHAIRRAPDGSAFEKCDRCEAMVPIALVDMHECEAKVKNKVKRFKGVCEKPKLVKQDSYSDQTRSPFRIFMETFVETCGSRELIDIDRKGFEKWKNMSKEERQPYVIKAEMLDAAHRRALLEEVTSMPRFMDDEADSAMVGKYDKSYDPIYSTEILKCSNSSRFESLNTYNREVMDPWTLERSHGRWLPFFEILG